MKDHTKKCHSRKLAQAFVILITATMSTGCASHRTITKEDIQHDTVITIHHDTVTLIQQATVRDTVREKFFLTLITDTTGRIIHEREVVHHFESHHHHDSTAFRQAQKDSQRTLANQRQHSVVKTRSQKNIFRRHIILLILVGCALFLFLKRK